VLLFVLSPHNSSDGLLHAQATRYVRMGRALMTSAPVAVACPSGMAAPIAGLDAKPYASERQLRAIVNDARVAVIPGDLLSTFPTIARTSARLVMDTAHGRDLHDQALHVGEFFLCGSEFERQRCLMRLIDAGRVRRARRSDLRRLVDVVSADRLAGASDGAEIERVVDPLRLYCTSSARQPRGWAWAPPSFLARGWRIMSEEGIATLASRVAARVRSRIGLGAGRARVPSPEDAGKAAPPPTLPAVRSIGELHQMLVDRRVLGTPPRFIDLEIDVSNRCNIRCQMCYFSFDQTFYAKPVYMKAGDFEAIAERVLPHAKAAMLSLGSEPLISPEFTRILEVAARYRVPELGFYTNGLLMNDRIIDAIFANRVTLVAVSIDGATKETFESIRRGANFDLLLKNVRALTRRRAELGLVRPRVRFGVVMMRRNIEELPDIVTLAWRLGVEELNFFHAVIYDGLDIERESLVHHKALSNEYLKRAKERAHDLGVKIVHNPSPFNLEGSTPRSLPPATAAQPGDPYCHFPFFHLSIDSSGRVRPCPFAHGEPPLGVVTPDNPIDKIWLGPAITELRERILANDPPPMCKRCSFLASSQPDRAELFDARPN
jgi:MoaA/NifB/PqqE/SkfB family radical SAM enzyme